MAYTLQARFVAGLDVVEIVDEASSPASGDTGDRRIYDQYSVDVQLTGETDSYPQVGNQVADLSHTLSGGTTKDFDLTAIPWAGDISKTFSASGKKIVGFILRFAITNNAAGVTFGPQGANGYALFGAAVVPRFYPGTNIAFGIADPDQAAAVTVSTPAVAGGAKDLRFTGADGDSWDCQVIFSE